VHQNIDYQHVGGVAWYRWGFLPADAAKAQGYPEREIRLVVPFPPGGPTDALGRQIAQYLGKGLGRPVVVDNRPGAGGTIAGAITAQAPADGYTLMFGNSAALATAPHLYPRLPYEPLKSFTAISTVSTGYLVIAVGKDVAVRDLSELIALAKAKPGALNYGSAGNGSPSHISGELLKGITGAQITHVPYKGGGPALSALLSGEVQIGIDLLPTLLPHIKSGRLRALAVAGPTRLPAIPYILTAAESGVPGFEMNLFTSLVAPAGIPRSIAERINVEMQKVLSKENLNEDMAKQSFTLAEKNNLQQANEFLREQVSQWAHFTKISNARVD
jgi:tripartite-type tricarboxylate transporter receptor subunit TctC